jgi:hypothetical protein
LITHTTLYAKPKWPSFAMQMFCLLRAMRVLEGRRAFAKGLGEKKNLRFEKNTHIKKSFFVLSFIFYFIVWKGKNTKK